MRRSIAALGLAALLVFACGDNSPRLSSGTIVGKEYDDADSNPCIYVGQNMPCMPQADDPERWLLLVRGWTGGSEGEGEQVTIKISVDQAEYGAAHEGDRWVAEED